MRARVHGWLPPAPVSLRERAFWACFSILVSLSALYGVGFATWLIWDEMPGHVSLAWRIAGACWVIALPPIWIIARWESRWVVRRVQEPILSLIRQCEQIRDGGLPARLRSPGRDEELGALAAALNGLLEHFNRIVIRQHQFAADAAHELRTPLTAQSVVGENALARRSSAAELREAVGSMLEESKHMQRLIESLLDLTRASVTSVADQEPAGQPVPLNLGELARGCVETLQVLAEEKHQRIELLARPVYAEADPTIVRQALLNVIHNAIEHCPPGTRIQVESARFGRNQAMLRVSDNGPGIPAEQQARLFDRFYRGPSAAGRRGLGLGLSIARALLKSQRGNIHLRSDPGAGCRLTLTLPLAAVASAVSVAELER